MNEITPQELKDWMKSQKITQLALANLLGVSHTSVSRWLKSVHAISGPEQKLLAYLIRGEMPFPVQIADEGWHLDFSKEEFVIIQYLSRRDGYSSPEEWVADKIRTYIAMTQTTIEKTAAAEQETPYRITSSN